MNPPGNTCFITGTDTGVGKTVLTALLAVHGRARGIDVLAVKPFCCGPPDDVELLAGIQGTTPSGSAISLWQTPHPVSPRAAVLKGAPEPGWEEACDFLRSQASKTRTLLVEGAGGAMVPIGRDWTLLDLIAWSEGPVIVVAPNRLGTLNHSLMTLELLRQRGLKRIGLVLMGPEKPDESSPDNAGILRDFRPQTPVFELPFLKPAPASGRRIREIEKKFEKTLAPILGFATFCAPSGRNRGSGRPGTRK